MNTELYLLLQYLNITQWEWPTPKYFPISLSSPRVSTDRKKREVYVPRSGYVIPACSAVKEIEKYLVSDE